MYPKTLIVQYRKRLFSTIATTAQTKESFTTQSICLCLSHTYDAGGTETWMLSSNMQVYKVYIGRGIGEIRIARPFLYVRAGIVSDVIYHTRKYHPFVHRKAHHWAL